MADHPSGILLVDKPSGPTSRQVSEEVGRLVAPTGRRRRGEPRFRMGHAGTLDPLATGLLVVLLGRATRLQPFLQGLDKRYLATVRLGVDTDSHDRDGAVTGTADVPADPTGLDEALAALTGDIRQVPPLISALKRDGRSLHHRVRRGEDVAPPPARPVRIHRLMATAVRWGDTAGGEAGELTAPDGRCYEIDLDVACGSGTYVRSLARDLATRLGTVGHLQQLRRLEVGPFDVGHALAPADLAALEDPTSRILDLAAGVAHLPTLDASVDQAKILAVGGQPGADWFAGPVPDLFRILAADGTLIAVGRRDAATGEPRTAAVFAVAGQPASKDDPCA